jgi:uncharacterized protein (DUF1501 family)
MSISRRGFLQLSALAGASFMVPDVLSGLASEKIARQSNKILVVINMQGGNDGLNTVIPYRNDIYYRSRPNISIEGRNVIRLTDDVGLHPALKGIRRLYDGGCVSIVNGVGVEAEDRSHRSSERRLIETNRTLTDAMNGRVISTDAALPIGEQMKGIGKLIKADVGTRIYYATHTGYDTHVDQKEHHHKLLDELDNAVMAFVEDLKRSDRFKDVMIMTNSEFGRRVAENEFNGTDHGTANSMFFISGRLQNAGIYNDIPDLADLDDGALKHYIDYRQVCASISDRWLCVDSEVMLIERHQSLAIV